MSAFARDLLEFAEFALRTREEGDEVARFISSLLPDPAVAGMCLSELVVNAVEHGNLEIGGELKCELLRAGSYERELAARYSAYPARRVRVSVRRRDRSLEITIADEGNGFPWRRYIDAELVASPRPNGRGIALVRTRFPDLEYLASGRVVIVRAELRS